VIWFLKEFIKANGLFHYELFTESKKDKNKVMHDRENNFLRDVSIRHNLCLKLQKVEALKIETSHRKTVFFVIT